MRLVLIREVSPDSPQLGKMSGSDYQLAPKLIPFRRDAQVRAHEEALPRRLR